MLTVADENGSEMVTPLGVTLDSTTVKLWLPSRASSFMIVILVHAVCTCPLKVVPIANIASKLSPLKSSPLTEKKRRILEL